MDNTSIEVIIEPKKIKKSKKSSSINTIIDEHIENDVKHSENNDEQSDIDVSSELSQLSYPKNHGNYWSELEREFILKSLSHSNITNSSNFFDDANIEKISKKIERSEYAVREEIKKMIFNEFIKGIDCDEIAIKFNMPIQNIKLLYRNYIDKHGKKFIENIRMENKILKLQIENLKLKKELRDFN